MKPTAHYCIIDRSPSPDGGEDIATVYIWLDPGINGMTGSRIVYIGPPKSFKKEIPPRVAWKIKRETGLTYKEDEMHEEKEPPKPPSQHEAPHTKSADLATPKGQARPGQAESHYAADPLTIAAEAREAYPPETLDGGQDNPQPHERTTDEHDGVSDDEEAGRRGKKATEGSPKKGPAEKEAVTRSGRKGPK